MILKKIFRFEIFCGICKIFLDCPFLASVFFLMVVTNVLLIIITLLPFVDPLIFIGFAIVF